MPEKNAEELQAIPSELRERYFSVLKYINDRAITVLQDGILPFQNEVLFIRDKPGIFLAFMCHHEDASPEFFMNIAEQLRLLNEDTLDMASFLLQLACRKGNIQLINLIFDRAYELRQNLAINKEEKRELFNWSKSDMQRLIVNNDDGNVIEEVMTEIPIHIAAAYGHFDVVNYLFSLMPEYQKQAIFYKLFLYAASNGKVEILKFLSTEMPDRMLALKLEEYHEALLRSVSHVNGLNVLVDMAGDRIEILLERRQYAIFAAACSHPKGFGVVKRLVELFPSKVSEMILAREEFHENVVLTSLERAINVFEYLDEISPDTVMTVMSNMSHHPRKPLITIMNNALNKTTDQEDTIRTKQLRYILAFSEPFAYAEMHEREYGEFVHPLIDQKISLLQQKQSSYIIENPNGVFDLNNPEEIRYCFYMIRNLIRRNDARLLDNIQFLLSIPAVKALAHTAVTPNSPNELLRLALAFDNQAAAEILMDIPAVRELAEQNNFYQNEVRGQWNLQQIAQDNESSLRGLSVGEAKRLNAAIEYYEPKIKESGISNLVGELRNRLAEDYKLHPAQFTNANGEIVILPLDKEAFDTLSLTEVERDEAIKEYYRHKSHTAWRYLSKPNLWMSEDANYVHRNETGQGWSTFEEYSSLIALMYLASIDETQVPIDAFTLETRYEHFIDELVQIGRAHNWDSSRERINASGQTIVEEFDDLEGDKPSCYSGVKRRLFQSVLGHPLLHLLTVETIKQELREYLRAHFVSCVNEQNQQSLCDAYQAYIVSLDPVDAAPLLTLNILPEAQEVFIEKMIQKYGAQFAEDASMLRYVKNQFFIGNKDVMHALKFAALTKLEQLLAKPEHGRASEQGFFAQNSASSGSDSHDEEKEKSASSFSSTGERK